MALILNLSMLGAKPTGLGVYSSHSASYIINHLACDVIANDSLDFLHANTHVTASPSNIAIGSGKLAGLRRARWANQIRLPDDKLLYSPTHHGILNHKNQIITIHDLICLRYPKQHYPQYLYFKYLMPRLLAKTRAVFTVSETSKADISDYYGYPKDKIFVVPNGVDAKIFSNKKPNPYNAPYLLMVGARYPHKNIDEVLEMCSFWQHDYRLVVTSCSGRYRAKLELLIKQKQLQGRVEFLDYVSYENLLALYSNASALIYPSKWEGFGIPPLEAFASGIPVIASDIAVHKEVLAEAGIFVRLGDSESWNLAFSQLKDVAIIADKIAASKQRLDLFTWENSGRILIDSLLAVEPKLHNNLLR